MIALAEPIPSRSADDGQDDQPDQQADQARASSPNQTGKPPPEVLPARGPLSADQP